jgi:hypothetical protein
MGGEEWVGRQGRRDEVRHGFEKERAHVCVCVDVCVWMRQDLTGPPGGSM